MLKPGSRIRKEDDGSVRGTIVAPTPGTWPDLYPNSYAMVAWDDGKTALAQLNAIKPARGRLPLR